MVSDLPAGDGNIEKLFLRCAYCVMFLSLTEKSNDFIRPFYMKAPFRLQSRFGYIVFYVTYTVFALDRQEDVRDEEIENSEHILCILAALNLIL